MKPLYIGVKGCVIAIDRATGNSIWEADLRGADFVNVVLDGDELYATSKGRLYRLDPATGKILWENGLAGKGWGLVSVAARGGENLSLLAEKKRRDAAAATAAATTTAT